MDWLRQAKEVIPDDVEEEMEELLNELGDDVGEQELGEASDYILKFEGWGGDCFPDEIQGDEDAAYGYAEDQTDIILKEWKQKFAGKAVFITGGFAPSGLYGITYALFKKIKPKAKKKR